MTDRILLQRRIIELEKALAEYIVKFGATELARTAMIGTGPIDKISPQSSAEYPIYPLKDLLHG